jgi:hypothetical protein
MEMVVIQFFQQLQLPEAAGGLGQMRLGMAVRAVAAEIQITVI